MSANHISRCLIPTSFSFTRLRSLFLPSITTFIIFLIHPLFFLFLFLAFIIAFYSLVVLLHQASSLLFPPIEVPSCSQASCLIAHSSILVIPLLPFCCAVPWSFSSSFQCSYQQD